MEKLKFKILIDTSDFETTRIALIGNSVVSHEFGGMDLSEKIIPEIKKFLTKQKVRFEDIEKIETKTGSHFSRTRTTVAVANGLIFALRLPQKMFEPSYDREPSITLKKL